MYPSAVSNVETIVEDAAAARSMGAMAEHPQKAVVHSDPSARRTILDTSHRMFLRTIPRSSLKSGTSHASPATRTQVSPE